MNMGSVNSFFGELHVRNSVKSGLFVVKVRMSCTFLRERGRCLEGKCSDGCEWSTGYVGECTGLRLGMCGPARQVLIDLIVLC